MKGVVTFWIPDVGGGAVTVDDVDDWQAQTSLLAKWVPDGATWSCRPIGDEGEWSAVMGPLYPEDGIIPESQSSASPNLGEKHVAEPTDVAGRLTEPFPREVLGSLNKGGQRLTYVPIAEVIARLNKVLGVGNWSTEIKSVGRDATNPEWVIAHVVLTIHVGISSGRYEHVGGQKIKTTRDGDIVDLGDEFKGAVSDALKKASQLVGIGLELARKDEALRYDEEQDEAAELSSIIAALKADLERLIPRGKAKYREWWKENANLPPVDHLDLAQAAEAREQLASYLQKQAVYLKEHPEEAPDYVAPKQASIPPAEGDGGGGDEAAAVTTVQNAFPGAEELEEPF